MKPRVMYVELKTGYADDGPAWIGWVKFSKTGRTVYYRGKTLQRGTGISGNHFDVETREEYWVSGVKRDGRDRHPAGGGPVHIDEETRARRISRSSRPRLPTDRNRRRRCS